MDLTWNNARKAQCIEIASELVYIDTDNIDYKSGFLDFLKTLCHKDREDQLTYAKEQYGN